MSELNDYDRDCFNIFRQDTLQRRHYREATPTPAQRKQTFDRVKSYMFEHGDHLPDGRVVRKGFVTRRVGASGGTVFFRTEEVEQVRDAHGNWHTTTIRTPAFTLYSSGRVEFFR